LLFIDTGPFLARYLERDQHHQEARQGWLELASQPYRCYTSSFVIDEFLTLLARRSTGSFAAERGYRIYASQKLEILRPEAEDEHEALKWLERFSDQRVSFTDCISFVLMRRYRVQIAFSFDRHFETAGFIRWTGAESLSGTVHDGGLQTARPGT